MTAGHPVPASAHPGVEAAYAHLSLITRGQTGTLAGGSWFPDLSEFNGPLDWGALGTAYRAGQIAAVAIRASFGTVRADARLAENQRGARSEGVPAIYYHFAYPAYNTAAAEAGFFNRVVGPMQANEAQAGDFEDDPNANPFPRGQAGLDWCRAFLAALQAPANATWGYSYPSLISTVGLQPIVAGWPFWLADYSATPDSAFAGIIARQFTDCGSTPGVGGCCDQSRVLRAPLSQWLTGGAPRGGSSMQYHPTIPGRVDDAITGAGNAVYHTWSLDYGATWTDENLSGIARPDSATCCWSPDGQVLNFRCVGHDDAQIYDKALNLDGSVKFDWHPRQGEEDAPLVLTTGPVGPAGPQGPPGGTFSEADIRTMAADEVEKRLGNG